MKDRILAIIINSIIIFFSDDEYISNIRICIQLIGEDTICRFDATRHAKGCVPVVELREEMQQTMQKYCSVFRTCDTLQRACREMTRLYTCDLPDLCVGELIEKFHLRKIEL